jgi:DNA invertase Pin-like site-specific DNA recombinase
MHQEKTTFKKGRRLGLVGAVAYLRTSSATNVGTDKDSEHRQRIAIETFAKSAGYQIVEAFYDAAVSGADDVLGRPGFAAMMKRIEGNGVRTIIVETASRFARDLMVQEVGFKMLRDRGIDLIAADSPHAFVDDGPTSKLIRQVLGAVAEFDKAMTVAKLRGARERKRREHGKCEGRKGHYELRPAAVRMAKHLAQASRTGERRSLRRIAAEMAGMGYLNDAGKPFAAASIKAMVDGPMAVGDDESVC